MNYRKEVKMKNINQWQRVRSWPKWVGGVIHALRRRFDPLAYASAHYSWIIGYGRSRFEYKVMFAGLSGDYDVVYRRRAKKCRY